MIKYLTFLCSLILSGTAIAHTNDGYSHDANIMAYDKSEWMADLADDARLSDLSIPGTHDSGSRYGGAAIENQVMTISQQLNAGIRYLDIRVRHIDNAFAIHHGVKYQHLNFNDVMLAVTDFLKQHGTETVIMRLHEEYEPSDNTRSINETLDSYLKKYQDYFISDPYDNYNPQLKKLRGKIFIIWDNFYGTGQVTAGGRSLNSIRMQDAWSVKTNWDLYGKWEKVKNFIRNNKEYDDLSINYLSASGGSFPYFIASGHSSAGTSAPRLATGLTTPGWKNKYPDFPRVSCAIGICTIAFEGTNTLTMDYLNANAITRTGIIAADFPGKGLISAVINKNTFTVKKLVSTRNSQCVTATNGQAMLASCSESAKVRQKISVSGDLFRNQNECLTAASAGSSVTFSACKNGQNQRWVYDDYHLVNIQNNKRGCLSTAKTGNTLTLNACNPSDNKQLFTWQVKSSNADSASTTWEMVVR